MNDALHMAASGMSAVSRLLDAAARNAVNAQTPGYLNRVITTHGFQTALDQALGRHGSLLETTESIGFRQGTVVDSDNPLHVALQGRGFLVTQGPAGPLYTRNGALTVGPEGTLVTQAGLPVLGESGPIHADLQAGSKVRIGEEGRVWQGNVEVGRLRVVEFDDPHVLERVGETLLTAPEGVVPRPAQETRVVPQHLELPPETSITAMVQMIEASKSFEAQQRVIMTLNHSYENLIRQG